MNYAKIGRPQRRYQILPGHACVLYTTSGVEQQFHCQLLILITVCSTFPIHVQYKNKQTSTSDGRPEQLKYHQLIKQTQASKIYIQEYVCVISSANRNTFVDIATPISFTWPVALFQVEIGWSSNSNSPLVKIKFPPIVYNLIRHRIANNRNSNYSFSLTLRTVECVTESIKPVQ
ncbi:hypothetical protein D917_04040 [Trichinella nativa]|uniref:Uncharacterized protein n=1 Tax=Trichinella nativa TaxID=6335 RepID=A0A1Y3E712_9BILA|nr:hypothetical protein D917_04040 [Trichinella nativa]